MAGNLHTPFAERHSARGTSLALKTGLAGASAAPSPHRTSMTHRPLRGVAALVVLVATAPAAAQSRSVMSGAVSLSAGVSQFDLAGTGNAPVVALRGELPLLPALLVEGGVAVARPNQQFAGRSTLVIPEVGMQVQYPARVAPYVGVGVGSAIDWRRSADGGIESGVTASGAAGVRAWATQRVGLRGELRVRGIGRGFPSSTAEWTLGAAMRF